MLKMNLPNKLTMLRIILVPIFVIFMSLPNDMIWPMWTAFGIFIFAALTDMLDGQIARRKNIVTKFGKIMDPLADKLLISSGFILLTSLGVIPGWITVIIVFRDFFVNALRMFGADKGTDLAAGVSGKIKTVFQLIAIPLGIISVAIPNIGVFASFTVYADKMDFVGLVLNVCMSVAIAGATIAAIWSLIEYIIKFKKDINVEE